jgi:hypothetical protein
MAGAGIGDRDRYGAMYSTELRDGRHCLNDDLCFHLVGKNPESIQK